MAKRAADRVEEDGDTVMANGTADTVDQGSDIKLFEKLREKPVTVKFKNEALEVNMGIISEFKQLARLLEVGDGQPIPLAGKSQKDFLTVVSVLKRQAKLKPT